MRICVFCSSKLNVPEATFAAARSFAQEMAARGIALVYGGGKDGLMGFFADEVLKAGGEVFGVMPEKAFPQEVDHPGLTKMYYTKDMLDRKRLMMELSDAFAVFPGGIGTMDEAIEVLTWKTVYKFSHPTVFYNVEGFWDPFFAMLKSYEKTGLFYQETMQSFKVVDSVDALLRECHA